LQEYKQDSSHYLQVLSVCLSVCLLAGSSA